MSIATSAVVRPSFCLRFWLGVFSLAALAAGVLLSGAAGASAGRYAGAWLGASSSLLVGLFMCRLFVLSLAAGAKPKRLDISAVGQIRLAVYHVMAAAREADGAAAEQGAWVAEPARLLPGSTLWPGFMLLRLALPGPRRQLLPLCPGSLAQDMFRPLSVACRTVAARNSERE